jgi:hypothetical protein
MEKDITMAILCCVRGFQRGSCVASIIQWSMHEPLREKVGIGG